MTQKRIINRTLKIIAIYCLLLILQVNEFVTYGQQLLEPVNDGYLHKENELNLSGVTFSNSIGGIPILQAPPEGEDDPEIIGIDKEIPVSDALPYFFVLCGIYCLLFKRKAQMKA